MYANHLLSRITNTKPAELGLDFSVRLGTFVFIPLGPIVCTPVDFSTRT